MPVTTRRKAAGDTPAPAEKAEPAKTPRKTPAKKPAAAPKTPKAAAAASPAPAKHAAKTDLGAGWAGKDGSGSGTRGDTFAAKLFSTLFTIFLMVSTPPFAILLWYSFSKAGGSVVTLVSGIAADPAGFIGGVWPSPSAEAWRTLGCWMAFTAAVQLFMPGKTWHGPVSVAGNVPVYTANGMQSYVFTLVCFFAGWQYGIFSPSRVTELFGEVLAALNVFAFAFCGFLWAKGHAFPSSTDSGSSGNPVTDFYWGMELYPRIGKRFDLKVFTNCRMGMMGWAVLILCFAVKQYERDGYLANGMAVSVFLMQVYIAKFFMWETGYWASMDIQYDRAGYYICWGCLVWVPSVYTSPAFYLAYNAPEISAGVAAGITALGLAAIWANYDADRQRQSFRESGGKVLVWGAAPDKIEAQYKTSTGETKKSLLLCSGWWGNATHLHYVFELTAAFSWSAPALFVNVLPYFYFIFLCILLADRARRDDIRCGDKYGKYWQQYRQKVPYKMVPYVW